MINAPNITGLQQQLDQLHIKELITLPSRETFINHPLFAHASEKEAVYEKLIEVVQHDRFSDNYKRFLDALLQEDWFSYCTDYFLEFSYLSIIAFFDNKIGEEQLCCIHTVAEAYRELQNRNIAGLQIHVLSKEDREANAEFLAKANQPPFAAMSDTPLVQSKKTQSELDQIKQELLDHISKIESPIARSVVVYSVQYDQEYSMEAGVYNLTKVQERYMDFTESPKADEAVKEVNTVLFPHDLGIILNSSIGLYPLPKEVKHEWMFGYADDVSSILGKGARVVSVASPLFDVPYVHEYEIGPKRLGLQMHDENYHIPLDLNIPNVMKLRFVELSQKMLQVEYPLTSPIKRKLWEDKSRKCSIIILDREVTSYRFETDPKKVFLEGFWGRCLTDIKQQEMPQWYDEVFAPLVRRVVYKKPVNDLMPQLKTNISMWQSAHSKKLAQEEEFGEAFKFAKGILDKTDKLKTLKAIAIKALNTGFIKDALKIMPLLDPLDRIRIVSQIRCAIQLNSKGKQ